MDRACSRFREDSELVAVNRSAGRPVPVSGLFLSAVDAALRAARLTGGLVDPTVGSALKALGYDRDFQAVDPEGPPLRLVVQKVPGWAAVRVDPGAGTVTLPPGVELDFGATAKALCADRIANRGAQATGVGILISLGGDISVAGPAPSGGWAIGIADDSAAAPEGAGCRVAISDGGLATSSTTVRCWRRGGEPVHHLVDPHSGLPAGTEWRTVSVAAGSCVDANIASCAAILMGPEAPGWLAAMGLPARLVRTTGDTVRVGEWPREEGGATASGVHHL